MTVRLLHRKRSRTLRQRLSSACWGRLSIGSDSSLARVVRFIGVRPVRRQRGWLRQRAWASRCRTEAVSNHELAGSESGNGSLSLDSHAAAIGIRGAVSAVRICDRVRREGRAETGLSCLPSLSRLSCWLDQKPHQRDQRDSPSACRDRPRGRGGATQRGLRKFGQCAKW